MRRASVLVALTILLTLPLSGCGRRGQLESPDGPAKATGQTAQEGRYSLGAQKTSDDNGDVPLIVPKRPFILDSIL